MMTNLFDETEKVLSNLSYTWEDIDWIGGRDFEISIENFREIARDTDYDSGYGSQKVASDLVIIMKDATWFERNEYDGAEHWVYVYIPPRPACTQHIFALSTEQGIKHDTYDHIGWETLDEINRP